MTSVKSLPPLSLLLALSLGGCSDPTYGSTLAAGAPGSAGTPATSAGAGGAGTSSSGAPSSGGTSPSAGTTAVGGSTPSGGASPSGGAPSSGGTSTSAGTSSGGGVGGSTPSGGTSAGGAAGADATGGTASGGAPSGEMHWVGTWAASPYLAASDAQPPSPLSNALLRQVIRVSIGGSKVRFQFSNLAGNGPVTIQAAHLAICKATPAVDSTIDPATDKALAFSGMESVTIPQGMEVWSDPLDFALAPLATVTITTKLGSVPSNLTAHAGSRTTSYVQAGGTDLAAANLSSAQKTDHWYFISGMDVMADASASAVAIIGDSITDGRGTDTNKNNRWTDVLATRLQANEATKNIGVLNQGIGATTLIGTGTAAEARFARDVLGQSGVKYAIIYDGVNDIGGNDASFQAMKAVYDKLIAAGKAKNVKVFGATIPPFGGNSYYSAAHEMVRSQVNEYIKSGVFDGVVDFDAALTDGGNPPKLKSEYAEWTLNNPVGKADGLHPGPVGYQKMGETVDLMLFK